MTHLLSVQEHNRPSFAYENGSTAKLFNIAGICLLIREESLPQTGMPLEVGLSLPGKRAQLVFTPTGISTRAPFESRVGISLLCLPNTSRVIGDHMLSTPSRRSLRPRSWVSGRGHPAFFVERRLFARTRRGCPQPATRYNLMLLHVTMA